MNLAMIQRYRIGGQYIKYLIAILKSMYFDTGYKANIKIFILAY